MAGTDRRAGGATATADAPWTGRARAARRRGARRAAPRWCRPASARRSAGARSPLRARAWSSSHAPEHELTQVREATEAGDALAALAMRRAQLDGVVDRVDADVQLVDEAKLQPGF